MIDGLQASAPVTERGLCARHRVDYRFLGAGNRRLEQRVELVPTKAAQRHRRTRLGPVGIAVGTAETEEISGEQKAGDLPSAVGELLRDAQCPGDDVVDVLGRVALEEKHLVRRQRDLPDDLLNAMQPVVVQRRTHGEWSDGAACTVGESVS